MADTERTVNEVLALLADNTARAISEQDLRDAVVSLAALAPRYAATLSQTGDEDPEATDHINRLTAAEWSYIEPGRYRLHSTNAFASDKTFGVPNVPKDVTTGTYSGYLVRVDASNVDLYIQDNAGAPIDGWTNVQLLIWVTP